MGKTGTMIYVASPYSHPNAFVREKRFIDVVEFTGNLMKEGVIALSPIAHCHMIAKMCAMPVDFEFWQNYCIGLIDRCDAVVVLQLKGWEDSRGIKCELEYAQALGLPISYERLK